MKASWFGPVFRTGMDPLTILAAMLGRDTAGLADFIASKPANDGMRDMDPRMVIQAGGLPVKFGNALVAGIGVGGAPSCDISMPNAPPPASRRSEPRNKP